MVVCVKILNNNILISWNISHCVCRMLIKQIIYYAIKPGTPWATSACHGTPLLYIYLY